ncbi:MAG: DNA glycosylase AlkZ-like family protein [Fimbriimonadales bacterium]
MATRNSGPLGQQVWEATAQSILLPVHSPVSLSKSDARRALVRHHFAPCASQMDAYDRLRSIQFDPIAPVGCNHDLVLQSRVPGYKIGDWQKTVYEDRLVYDGWDKQASLVPMEGWPVRRVLHERHKQRRFQRIFNDHADAMDAILKELQERGPLLPREFRFQERKEEWKGSWYGPSLAKQVLRALWHSGQVMTSGRRNGHHVYDLTERVVPARLYNQPMLPDEEAMRELVLERHRATGLLRPTASYEVWSYMYSPERATHLAELTASGEIVPVDVEGMKAHATPEFLSLLDQPSLQPRVVFIAPLDQFMWDRKMIGHLFDFDYVWEIYVPEAKRRWGYYVLPVLFGDALAARAEFWCREGVLELRRWHFEPGDPHPTFFAELELSLGGFMKYCSATRIIIEGDIDPKVRDLAGE